MKNLLEWFHSLYYGEKMSSLKDYSIKNPASLDALQMQLFFDELESVTSLGDSFDTKELLILIELFNRQQNDQYVRCSFREPVLEKRKNATKRKTRNAKRKTAVTPAENKEENIRKAKMEIAKKIISSGVEYASDLTIVKDDFQEFACEKILKRMVEDNFDSNDAVYSELRNMIWGISSRREKALKEQGDDKKTTVIVGKDGVYYEHVDQQNIHPLENERKLLPGSEHNIKTQRR